MAGGAGAGNTRYADFVRSRAPSAPAGTAAVSVWCLQDLVNPSVNGSLTSEKARVPPALFEYAGSPRLVIAFGTAADPQKASRNGTTAIGSSVFIHNPYAGKPQPPEQWEPPHPDAVVSPDAAPLLDGLARETSRAARTQHAVGFCQFRGIRA